MPKAQMKLDIRRVPHMPNLFEFSILTPTLRTQFRLSRTEVNQLRILLEKVLISK